MLLPAIDRLGQRQHGLVTRTQLLAIAGSEAAADRLVGGPAFHHVHPGVYRCAGAPVTWDQQLLAGAFAVGDGAVASHRAAAVLWGLLDEAPVEVTVDRPHSPRPAGVVVHRSEDLARSSTHLRRGIPCTNPMRTIVDLGAVMAPPVVEDCLDRGLTQRLFTIAGVETALEAVARRGRRGAGVLRRILDERALGDARPDSLLESRMARLLKSAELPPAAFQHDIYAGRRFVGRVDFAYPEVRLAIEVDGWEAHASPEALQGDLSRQNALVGAGWAVLRFTWHDVVRRPPAVATAITRVLGPLTLAQRR